VLKKGFTSFLILLVFANLQTYSQSFCRTANINSTAAKRETFVYKQYIDEDGDEHRLRLGLVRPVDNLPDKKRPLIIGVHSGGFLDICLFEPCFVKYSEGFLTRNFIPLGAVTVSVEYRLASLLDLKPPKIKDEKLKEAHYKAVQDVRDAVRYIFKNADKLNVDTENVFLAGTSAGAITVLHAAFLDNDEVSKDLAEKYGLLAKSEKIRGVISFAGALYDLSYLEGGNKIPLLIVHGTEDSVVPIDKGYYFEMKHLTPVYGGRAVYEEARKKGISAKGLFYDYGHSLPDRFSKEVFKNVNEFIRSNMDCGAQINTGIK
jgi:predicted esterase